MRAHPYNSGLPSALLNELENQIWPAAEALTLIPHLNRVGPISGPAGEDGDLVALGARERREAVRRVPAPHQRDVQLLGFDRFRASLRT